MMLIRLNRLESIKHVDSKFLIDEVGVNNGKVFGKAFNMLGPLSDNIANIIQTPRKIIIEKMLTQLE